MDFKLLSTIYMVSIIERKSFFFKSWDTKRKIGKGLEFLGMIGKSWNLWGIPGKC